MIRRADCAARSLLHQRSPASPRERANSVAAVARVSRRRNPPTQCGTADYAVLIRPTQDHATQCRYRLSCEGGRPLGGEVQELADFAGRRVDRKTSQAARETIEVGFAMDSPLEESGFELSVPPENLPGVPIHDLRHSFASVAVSSGESLYIVGKILGHRQARNYRGIRAPGSGPGASRGRSSGEEDC
jgi:hypothetical protein